MNVLIVEDEFISRILLLELLQSYGNCTIATNGREALEMLRQSYCDNDPFDLVCLDIVMPGMDGQRVLLEMRRMEQEQHRDALAATPVFMVTSLDDSYNIIKAFTEGCCQAYLTKPVDRNKLTFHLRECRLVHPAMAATASDHLLQ